MTDASLQRALDLDRDDPGHRERFHIPTRNGRQVVYLCGNSLGLQPRATREFVGRELDAWAERGVNGHFEGERPWFAYHEQCTAAAAHLVGALPHEVVVMNALTVNLHLLMVSFYRPTAQRYRIVIEAGAFPSDRYAVASQARLHGFDPQSAIVELRPRPGESLLREEDIANWLDRSGDTVALVLLGGVNYYSGQLFDLESITRAGRSAGAAVGFDLAHAVGNVELRLHDWGVDFAAWCSYKYLNSGPGGVAGAFVHDRHARDASLPRMAGWWGNDPETRFEMPREFAPQLGAAGWQLSNAPVLPMAAFLASAELFVEAGMPALRARSLRLTAYLLELLDARCGDAIEILTPREPQRRGCQLSLGVHGGARDLQGRLDGAGIVCDFRPPDVIRAAPVPLYNTYEDVWRFVDVLAEAVRV